MQGRFSTIYLGLPKTRRNQMIKHQLPTIFDDFNEFFNAFNGCSSPDCCKNPCSEGISISEDEEKLYIDAALPGVKSDEVEVTLDPKKRHLLKEKGLFQEKGLPIGSKADKTILTLFPFLTRSISMKQWMRAQRMEF